jgi:hypothetical protein
MRILIYSIHIRNVEAALDIKKCVGSAPYLYHAVPTAVLRIGIRTLSAGYGSGF